MCPPSAGTCGAGVQTNETQVAWVFSIILESVCVLPQLVLLRQTTVPTVIDSYYLLTLGSYRGFYILNWIWREFDPEERRPPDAVSIIFGVIQTAFYIDFAWVYYSRQRVKLRNGGIVDSDDLRNSWLLRTVFRHKPLVGDEDEESAPGLGGSPTGNGRHNAPGRNGSKWGARGISVSADDGVLDGERERQNGFAGQQDGVIDTLTGEETDPDAKMKDPDELARILDDDDDDDDGVLPGGESSERVGNGSEWREGISSK
jgi:ER lumen protein retaining receptor